MALMQSEWYSVDVANGSVWKVPRLPVGVDCPRGGVDDVDFLRALAAVVGNRPFPERLAKSSIVCQHAQVPARPEALL
jgi:hypothetical protein